MDLLDATRAALAVAMLCGAAVLDLRSRRVPNAYWLPFGVAAAALIAVDAGLRGAAAFGTEFAVAAAVAAAAWGAWRLRLFGGADAKALMVLAFIAPTVLRPMPDFPLALNALANGALLALAYPPLLLAWNAAHGNVRLPAALLAVPMPLALARARHVWPVQEAAPDGSLRWRFTRRVGMEAEAVYDGLAAAGVQEVWVTHKVPLVAFLAAGAVVAVAWGNVMLRLVEPFAAP